MAHFASISDLHHVREISSADGFWQEKDDKNDSELNAFPIQGEIRSWFKLKALFDNVFTLKPQDSISRFVKIFLDLQKVDHTIRKHH